MKKSGFLQVFFWGLLLAVLLAIPLLYFKQGKESPLPPAFGRITSFTLTNQHGTITSAEDLTGKVWVADVIFTHCPVQCLKMTRHMAQIQKQLGPVENVRLVSITADPGHDTPQVLKDYAKKFEADQSQWLFLTGTTKEINELAVHGLKLVVLEKKPEEREIPEDLFVHSNKFVVIDKSGNIRGWFDGDLPEVVSQVTSLVNRLGKE